MQKHARNSKMEFKTDECAFETWSIRNLKNSMGSHSLNKKELYSVSFARIWKMTITMTTNGAVQFSANRKKESKKNKNKPKIVHWNFGFYFRMAYFVSFVNFAKNRLYRLSIKCITGHSQHCWKNCSAMQKKPKPN